MRRTVAGAAIVAAAVVPGLLGQEIAGRLDLDRTYDVLIRGGMIVDGTGRDPYRADLVIAGDTIAYVGTEDTQRLKVETTIDASGKVVTPGFIDPHAHGDPLTDPLDNSFAQGVTTVVLGQDGRTPGFSAEDVPTLEAWRAATSSPDADDEVVTLARWMKAVEARGSRTNIATLVGHGSLRYLAGVGSNTDLTDAQQAVMNEGLQAGIDAGAFGMSAGLEYVPGRNAPRKELVSLAKVVGQNDGVIMSHLRSEDAITMDASDTDAVLFDEALDEIIELGRYARVHVAHIKLVYGKNAEQGEAVRARLQKARDEGIQISSDVYPYLSGVSNFYFLYPIWARERPVFENAVAHDRQKLADDMYERVTWRGGADKALIVSGEFAGKTLAEIAAAQHKPFVDVIMDWGYGGPTTAHFTQNADLQDVFITSPDTAIGSDGSPTMRHPRSFGTFPTIIQEYVVESQRLSLELAVRKMTGLPARILGLEDRGTLAIGKKADVLVFDPAQVKAKASWADPTASPEGFDYMLVNGRVAAVSDTPDEHAFGRVLRAHARSR